MTPPNSPTNSANSTLSFELPAWLLDWERTLPETLRSDEAAMRIAIEAAERNVRHDTGGPFGAVVVDVASGAIAGIGVNIVVSGGSSVLHAEMVALMRAQRRGGFHKVGGADGSPTALYSSAEPCAMCLGAIPWSGVDRIVCGATDADVRAIGFDEGDKPADWLSAYRRRGIAVSTEVLRDEAVAVLRAYRTSGGIVY
ncbi:MAG: nucleoside deaminase [Kiritimatiellia bacterium]|jgi:tRNA(Arg) A34 adenosine deaminase TadA